MVKFSGSGVQSEALKVPRKIWKYKTSTIPQQLGELPSADEDHVI